MSGRNDPPMTVEHLVKTAYEYYADFHENPRRIHYMELSQQIGAQNIRVLDYVAEALDLGCEDAKTERGARSKKELLDAIGHPADERWNLVAGEETEAEK